MTAILSFLNQYSNLMLVIITAIYVVLTWRMAHEMRLAREAALEAHLVTTIIPLGGPNAQYRIHNVGQGPALDVEATISMKPVGESETRIWRSLVLSSNSYRDFIFPVKQNEFDLKALAASYDYLVVDVKWQNLLRHTRAAHFEIDLKRYKEGAWKAGALMPPRDIPSILEEIKKEESDKLQNIKNELADLRRAIQENIQRSSEKD